jgi:hypothetical protein
MVKAMNASLTTSLQRYGNAGSLLLEKALREKYL